MGGGGGTPMYSHSCHHILVFSQEKAHLTQCREVTHRKPDHRVAKPKCQPSPLHRCTVNRKYRVSAALQSYCRWGWPDHGSSWGRSRASMISPGNIVGVMKQKHFFEMQLAWAGKTISLEEILRQMDLDSDLLLSIRSTSTHPVSYLKTTLGFKSSSTTL